MISLSPNSLILFLTSLSILIVVLLIFRHRQNTNSSMGGKISPAKSYWLGFALMVYYVCVPVLIWDTYSPSFIRFALSLFFGVFLLRGLLQMILMYILKSWTTTMGILANGLGLLALIVPFIVGWSRSERIEDGGYLTVVGLIASCLILDSYYAWRFNRLVKGQTQGDDGIWFASSKDPAFFQINRITYYANMMLTGLFLLITLQVQIQ